jgi:hypothetical protein
MHDESMKSQCEVAILKKIIYSRLLLFNFHAVHIQLYFSISQNRGVRGGDRMIVGFATICAISTYHH